MKTIAIIQARLNSRRFPRKVLATLGQQTVLEHVCQRALLIPGVSRVIVTCPASDGAELNDLLGTMPMPPEIVQLDGPTFLWPRATLTLAPWDGPEADVLGRFAYILSLCDPAPDAVLRLTGDCPLLDPRLCEMVLEEFTETHADYTSNCYPTRTFPDGLDCEAMTAGILTAAHGRALRLDYREHVTQWIREQGGLVTACVATDPSYGHLRWTIDTQADLAYLNRLLPLIPVGETSWLATLKAAQELEAQG